MEVMSLSSWAVKSMLAGGKAVEHLAAWLLEAAEAGRTKLGAHVLQCLDSLPIGLAALRAVKIGKMVRAECSGNLCPWSCSPVPFIKAAVRGVLHATVEFQGRHACVVSHITCSTSDQIRRVCCGTCCPLGEVRRR